VERRALCLGMPSKHSSRLVTCSWVAATA